MRAPVVLMLLLPLVPVASAVTETSPLTHLSVQTLVLEPGENYTRRIETGEGPWQEGMLFVLNGFRLDADWLVQVELIYNHSRVPANEWTFTQKEVVHGTAMIPHDDGPYELRFTNRGADATRFRYFFDQSCACTAKPIGLNQGLVVFAYDFKLRHRYDVAVPLMEGWELKGEMATVTGPVGDLEDFKVYERKVAVGPNWLNFTLVAPHADRFYFFYTALQGARFGTQDTLTVTVLLEESAVRTPGFAAILALGALGLALGPARRL